MPPKRPPPLVPKKPNPSMNYEVLIYLNSFYFGMFACCEMAMGLLKAINLSYTGHTLAQDSAVMISFIVVETFRLIMGRKGTLAERGRRHWRPFNLAHCLFIVVINVVFVLTNVLLFYLQAGLPYCRSFWPLPAFWASRICCCCRPTGCVWNTAFVRCRSHSTWPRCGTP